MSPLDLVLQQAEQFGVKRSGTNRWRMRGACHNGRSVGGVSIAEGEAGAVLLKCWAGCGVERVAAALGLQLEQLFPGAPQPAAARRRPFTHAEAIRAFRQELRVVWLLLADLAAGRELGPDVRKRAGVARERCMALLSELDRND